MNKHIKEHEAMDPRLHVYPRTQDHGEILPPHWIEESDEGFSIGFDLLACKEDSIRFLVNKQQRHLTVVAKLEGQDTEVDYLWTFALPLSADLDHVGIKNRGRVYSLTFPRFSPRALAGEISSASGTRR